MGPLENDPLEVDNVMVQLADGAQQRTNLLDVVSQSTVLHKCTALILLHVPVKSSIKIGYVSQHEPSLINLKGSQSKITYLPLVKPNSELGFKRAIDGNQKHEFKFRVEKVNDMCKAAVSIKLTQTEAITMLNFCLVPQTIYVM